MENKSYVIDIPLTLEKRKENPIKIFGHFLHTDSNELTVGSIVIG